MARKNIPIYFDNVVIMSPAVRIGETNLNRLKVGVFTKYDNRNGSYIKDDVAEMLIASATRGDTPVVGFFDPQSTSWSSHTGPTLASAYGYVEGFDGWEPFQDKDGTVRDYAVFSTVLFNKYFDQANYIVGQNQSMELDINSIEGDWADIDGQEYFVYTKAEIMGLCVIGSHEPCFSVSSFFAKQDEQYKSQYDKFSSLLADLKAQVEEAERKPEGGEHQMEDNMNPEVNESAPAQEPAAVTEPVAAETEPVVEPAVEPQVAAEPEPVPELEPVAPAIDFEARVTELENLLQEMTTNYENAQARIVELEAQITSASATESALREEIATYAAERNRLEVEQKNTLIERYENRAEDEVVNDIREHLADYSCHEIESKLAISFANKQMAGNDTHVVPLPEPVVDELALFMQKYRKD